MSDTFFNAPSPSTDEDIVTTMGGLDGLPGATPTTQSDQPEAPSYLSRIMPDINLGDFIGSAAQLSQLFPGTQVKPSYQPGLTDLRFTRGYYGPQEDVSPTGFGTESAGTLFWSPTTLPDARAHLPDAAAPTRTTERQRRENEAILQGALGMDWSGAYQDYLNRLEAESQDVDVSNVFTPTNVNYQTQSQQQQQSMGGGQQQQQQRDFDQQDTGTDYSGLLAALAAAGLTGAAIGGIGGGGGGGSTAPSYCTTTHDYPYCSTTTPTTPTTPTAPTTPTTPTGTSPVVTPSITKPPSTTPSPVDGGLSNCPAARRHLLQTARSLTLTLAALMQALLPIRLALVPLPIRLPRDTGQTPTDLLRDTVTPPSTPHQHYASRAA